MQLKIYGGTASSIDLCLTCECRMIVRGQRESDEHRACDAMGGQQIPFRVAQCSRYREDNNLTAAGALYLSFDSTEDFLRVSKVKWAEGVPVGEFLGTKGKAKIRRKRISCGFPQANENCGKTPN